MNDESRRTFPGKVSWAVPAVAMSGAAATAASASTPGNQRRVIVKELVVPGAKLEIDCVTCLG